MENYPGLKFIYHDVPLEIHNFSVEAGEAAICAGEQDKYWRYHDLIFDRERELENGSFVAFADEETKSFDIDKMTTGITSSKRSKILLVRDTIFKLESRVGKMVPLEEIERELIGKIKPEELDDALSQLKKSGEIFNPNSKHIQRTSR